MGVTYDTGALVAAGRHDRRMWAFHAEVLRRQVVPVVPAPVVAQAWRGGHRQAALSRLLTTCWIEPMSARQAHDIGAFAGRAAHDDIVDVAVVEGAVRRGDVIVTSDAADVRRILDALRVRLPIEEV